MEPAAPILLPSLRTSRRVICALLLKLEKAVVEAKHFITQAIRMGFPIGSGHSPVHHFYHFWKKI